MCSEYWNLTVPEVVCPACDKPFDAEFQTHFMGQPGSCVHYYHLDEVIPELERTSGTLPKADLLAERCPNCGAWLDFGARFKDGQVTTIWYAQEPTPQATLGH